MGTNIPMRFGVRDMFIRAANLNLLNLIFVKDFLSIKLLRVSTLLIIIYRIILRALLFIQDMIFLMNLKLPLLFQILKSGIRQSELPSWVNMIVL